MISKYLAFTLINNNIYLKEPLLQAQINNETRYLTRFTVQILKLELNYLNKISPSSIKNYFNLSIVMK